MSLPVVDYLKLPEGEEPYLEGHKCKECGSEEIYYDSGGNYCTKCGIH